MMPTPHDGPIDSRLIAPGAKEAQEMQGKPPAKPETAL